MTQTKSDISALVLRRLGIVREGQAAAASQDAIAKGGIDRWHAELAHHGVAFWNVDACPDDVASAFAQYVAGDVATEFFEVDKAQFFASQMGNALRRMTLIAGVRDFSDRPVKFGAF